MSLIPKNYFDSRERFRTLAVAAGGRVSSFPVSSSSLPDGSLSVESVFLGNEEAHKVVVMVSGVHGVEGYAGSACIQHFLQRYKTHYDADGTAFLIIHALNPWGFANDSRVTENNIDLNRNFINFSAHLPSSVQYLRFHSSLCEEYRPGPDGLFNEMKLFSGLLMSAKKRRAFQQAVTAGQYECKDGLFYGGTQITQNRIIFDRIVQAHLCPDQDIRFLDIHTGLGKKGHGALLTHVPVTSAKFQDLNRWLDGQLTSTTQDTNISALISGPLPVYLEDQLGERCHTLTLEFGVASPFTTLNALRADNWLRAAHDKNAAVLHKAAIKKRIKQAFLSGDPGWELAVLSRFSWTMDRLVHGTDII